MRIQASKLLLALKGRVLLTHVHIMHSSQVRLYAQEIPDTAELETRRDKNHM